MKNNDYEKNDDMVSYLSTIYIAPFDFSKFTDIFFERYFPIMSCFIDKFICTCELQKHRKSPNVRILFLLLITTKLHTNTNKRAFELFVMKTTKCFH